jgi:hypothetical protein
VSAAYLLPLLFEKQFFNLNAFVAEGGGFDFSKFFMYPNMTGQMPPGNFWPVYYREFESTVFLLAVCICIFLIRVLRIRIISPASASNIVNLFFLVAALWSLFLLFGASSFLWNFIPFFKYIQFPFRWLNVTVFLVGFLFSAAGYWILENKKDKHSGRFTGISTVVLLFLVCALYDYKYIVTSPVFTPDELMPPRAVNWTKEHLPAGVDMNKIKTEEIPGKRISLLSGEGNAEVITWNSSYRSAKTVFKEDSRVRIRTFYFPGWQAYLDGIRTKIIKEDGTGAMLIDIPQGKHLLDLKFVDTPIRYYSKFVSIFSLLLVTIIIGMIRNRKTTL